MATVVSCLVGSWKIERRLLENSFYAIYAIHLYQIESTCYDKLHTLQVKCQVYILVVDP